MILIKYGFELDTVVGGGHRLFSSTLSLRDIHSPTLWKPTPGRETTEISRTLELPRQNWKLLQGPEDHKGISSVRTLSKPLTSGMAVGQRWVVLVCVPCSSPAVGAVVLGCLCPLLVLDIDLHL